MVYDDHLKADKSERMRIGCVIMASGASKRFGGGKNKLLEDLGGKPLILHTAGCCRAAGLSPVIVTRLEEIRRLAEENGYDCVIHDDPEKSATIRHGLKYLLQEESDGSKPPLSGCLFIPGDQPLVRPESVRHMLNVFYAGEADTRGAEDETGSAPVVRLSWEGIGKSPVIFPEVLFSALMALEGNQGGSTILSGLSSQKDRVQSARILLAEAKEECELLDADTPEALWKIQGHLSERYER